MLTSRHSVFELMFSVGDLGAKPETNWTQHGSSVIKIDERNNWKYLSYSGLHLWSAYGNDSRWWQLKLKHVRVKTCQRMGAIIMKATCRHVYVDVFLVPQGSIYSDKHKHSRKVFDLTGGFCHWWCGRTQREEFETSSTATLPPLKSCIRPQRLVQKVLYYIPPSSLKH